MCGACGSTNMVDGYFYNKEKDIKLRLCDVCAKTAQLNGYVPLNVTNREQALKTVGHILENAEKELNDFAVLESEQGIDYNKQ